MNESVKNVFVVLKKESNNTKKLLQALQIARSVMCTFIVYTAFVKAADELKKYVNKNETTEEPKQK